MNSDNHLHLVRKKATTFMVPALVRPFLGMTWYVARPKRLSICWREKHVMSLQHLFQVQV